MKYGLFSIVGLFFLLFPSMLFAHSPGEPPYFKVNGKYANFYPVLNISGSVDKLPHDIAPEAYLINQPISFVIDVAKLPLEQEIINNLIFAWEMGDGTKARGLKNIHSYTRPGSYTITISIVPKKEANKIQPQPLQSMMLHVLPHKKYILPQAIMTISGKKIIPVPSYYPVQQNEALIFDASHSKSNSSTPLNYQWDFGDGNKNGKKKAMNTYDLEQQIAYPRLRVIDKNGFISDTAVQLMDESKVINSSNNTQKQTNVNQKNGLANIFAAIFFLLIGIGGILLYLFNRRK